MDLSTTFTKIMLEVMGALFILPVLIFVLNKLIFRLRCKVAVGKLIRIEKNKDEEGNVMINPVYEFVNYRFEKIELRRGTGYGLKYLPEVGDQVKIYYSPVDSQKADIASSGLWFVSGVMIASEIFILTLANFL